ncbi:zf-HC2 domain-containing protein [Streptomyces pinistramenti]|uniref:zf-HC2 domain-containing protein n=1 Tax=Streptomyces pinistramenti TaxID=2884812 RepID=UPI001D074DF3|nr:zf-HC2 domain-containing protein [Streptomyces pinistramenti]MCB5911896.1 zf-HC2 domain-containing protein [Streptomyces pinistramenti]
MIGSGGASPAEQHLGDRLAALVDGELGHDARERVLAHLATCGKCKAEADAQRRLKSVFARTAPPGPSEGFLARLQGLPGGDQDGQGSRPAGGLGGGFGRPELGSSGGSFGYLPSDAHALGAAAQPRRRGFRIHETERPAPQRRRFAFAAAGAVSLAAIALGGALPLEAAVDAPNRQEGGNAVTPLSAEDGSDPLRSGGFLTAGDARSAVGGPTVAPAPSSMGLYGPSSPRPPVSPSARVSTDGRFGSAPLMAPTDRAVDAHLAPLAVGSVHYPRAHTPPLERERPLIGSASSPAPAGQGSAAARR